MAEAYPRLEDRPLKNTICLFDVDNTLTIARRVSGDRLSFVIFQYGLLLSTEAKSHIALLLQSYAWALPPDPLSYLAPPPEPLARSSYGITQAMPKMEKSTQQKLTTVFCSASRPRC